MQPTGRQQHVGRTGEAPHAHITMAPVRGLREVGHAKLRFHQVSAFGQSALDQGRSSGRLLVPRWRLMVKSSLKLVPPSRSGIAAQPWDGTVSLIQTRGSPQPFSIAKPAARQDSPP